MGERLGDESLLETPTYVVAVVLAGFQVAALVFTFVMWHFKHMLRRRKRMGLLHTVAHMEEELMLVGFISLCLIALQQPLTSICVDASPSRADWTMLHHVYGSNSCDCCLDKTINVKPCVLKYAHCGNVTDPFCNCNDQDPQCAAEGYVLAEGKAVGAPPSGKPAAETLSPPLAEGGRRRSLLGGAAAADGHPAAITGLPDHGWTATGTAAPHAGQGRALLSSEGGDLIPSSLAESECEGAVTVHGSCEPGKMPVVSFLALEQVHLLIFTVSVVHVLCGFVLYFGALLRIRLQWAHWERRDDVHAREVRKKLDTYYASLEAGQKGPQPGAEAASVAETASGGSPGGSSGASAPEVDLEQQAAEGAGAQLAPAAGEQAPKAAPAQGQLHSPLPSVLPRRALVHSPPVAAPLGIIGDGKEAGAGHWGGRRLSPTWVVESLKCLLYGQFPRVVSPDQYALLRASFLYTHKLGPKFAFLDFVQSGLEDDLSHVVGLSFEFWLLIILFVLISGPWGFLIVLYMGLAALVLVVTNCKLAKIIRSVTERGGAAARLTSGVFWFNRPPILLIPIKMALFICAFIYAWFVFAVWQFGAGSCPFTKAFYPGWVLPWYWILIFNTLIIVHMGAVSMPTYSLAVQMGSDWKAHMLPKKLTKRLLAIAASTKQRAKAVQEAAHTAPPQSVPASAGATRDGDGAEPSSATVMPGADGGHAGRPLERTGVRLDRMVSGVVKHLVGDGEE